MEKQKNITLHIPEGTRRAMLIRAAQKEPSLKEYITALIAKDMAQKGRNDHE